MRIAEGDYIFWIMKAEAKDGMLNITFQSRRLSLTESFAISGPDVWRLREMLEACGKKILRPRGKINLDKLIGLECAGTVVNDAELGPVISAFFEPQVLKQQFHEFMREMSEINTQRYLM